MVKGISNPIVNFFPNYTAGNTVEINANTSRAVDVPAAPDYVKAKAITAMTRAGTVRPEITITYIASASGCYLQLRKNGTTVLQTSTLITSANTFTFDDVSVAKGDTLGVWVRWLNVSSTATITFTPFQIKVANNSDTSFYNMMGFTLPTEESGY